MQVGEMIRKHRKDNNMTQDEVAKRLGVTAPAVNKWENGNSLPDITLLSPIARLFNISVDALLSHEEKITDFEANKLVEEAVKKLKSEPLDDVVSWIKACITKYPCSYFLILWMARILEGHLTMNESSEIEKYEDYIFDIYKRVIESEKEDLRSAAAESLYHFCMGKKQYEDAESYLNYFSKENPEHKRKLAKIYSETDKQDQAYKMYEELLFSGYQSLNMTFYDIFVLATKDENTSKAHLMIEKIQKLAKLFEFGEYHEISSGLDLATLDENQEQTIDIAKRMLNNLESIYGFSHSPLYEHMAFKEIDENYLPELRENLLKSFRNQDSFAELKNNSEWRELINLS